MKAIDTAREAVVRYYGRRYDELATLGQTGDYEAVGAASILLDAWTGELDTKPGEPLPEPEGACPCPACWRYLTRDWTR